MLGLPTALVVIAGIMLYLMVIGIARPHFYNHYYKTHNRSDTNFYASVASIFWIVTLPIAIGTMSSGALPQLSKTSRTEKRRERELDEADHRIAMARRLAAENAILDRELNHTR